MTQNLPGNGVGKSLDAATAAGPGVVFQATKAIAWSLQAISSGPGSPGSTTALELSNDGVNFFAGGAVPQDGFTTFGNPNPVALYARANLTFLGNNTSVTAYVSGDTL